MRNHNICPKCENRACNDKVLNVSNFHWIQKSSQIHEIVCKKGLSLCFNIQVNNNHTQRLWLIDLYHNYMFCNMQSWC